MSRYDLFYRLAILLFLTAVISSCEVHDDVDTSVKRKAVVYLLYNYNDGKQDTMDEVQNIRLFLFDLATDRLYRDTTLTREAFLTDTGAMQTYISNGRYEFVCMANVGHGSTVSAQTLSGAHLDISEQGADPLFFGRVQTPIVKGDSLRFDIALFKSVYKINVLIEGLQNLDNPEEFYFGLENYSSLTFANEPAGEFKLYKPELVYNSSKNTLSGSFYTPYFPMDSPITLGIYTDNPSSVYGHTLFESSIRRYMEIGPNIGGDVEIDVHIIQNGSYFTITISDWEGTIVQEEHFGA